ncbi:uncharacterized protein LOC124252695 [Haliotis rubra]|uniref:uncharacterized protein LOC124252695 n=1 Tax=Haliotis rubra TaxID=36100 RepID=UPI001EE5E150|nr:uncharacterized protein LOC124252695 [Haliotis rubra]
MPVAKLILNYLEDEDDGRTPRGDFTPVAVNNKGRCYRRGRRARTDGKLDIRFISYWSDGKEISGKFCDNHLRVWCNDKCDPKFTICIDGLKIEVRAYCDRDWYGSACEKHCKATPDHSHYTCHTHTGAKMCFEGRRCENIINQCVLAPCLNGGTCHGNETAFNCTCSVEWTGETCAEKVNYCDSDPCNRGNCTPDFLTATRFKCNCDFAWIGERCSHAVDIINITLLGEIDHTKRGDLAFGLNRLITELGGIPGKVDVKFTTNTQKESNYTTTYIQLYFALENGSILESASLIMIFESNPDEVINEYLPLPVYPRQQEEKAKITVIQTMATERLCNRWENGRYVKTIGTPLGFVLMTVLFRVVFWVWRKRSHTSDQFLEDDQISLFVMDVACNRNLNRPGNVTGTVRQDASVSPDGYTSLHFNVHDGSLDTDCDDTSHIHIATEDMIFDPVLQDDNNLHDDEANLDNRLHVASYIQPVPEDITLDPGSQEDEQSTLSSMTTMLRTPYRKTLMKR